MRGKQLASSAKDGIWTVRLNRPEARNAISYDLMQQLTDTALRLRDEPGVRAVILTGAGDHFCAGVDLKEPRRHHAGKLGLAERRALSAAGGRLSRAWEEIPAMTICAIEGHCIGGGAALAVATDFRVIGASAYFWLPEIAIGIPLGWGAVPRLVNLLGPAKAKRFIILCDKIGGQEAVDFGLADYLVPDGKTYASAVELAHRIAGLPETSVRMSKETINATANALNHLASHMAADQHALAAASDEAVAARERFAARKKAK
jgi:enoyl-CoA hydratase